MLQPAAMTRLHVATRRLAVVSSLEELLPAVVDGAVELTGADFGSLQLVDPVTLALRVVTRSGLGDDVIKHFTVVDDLRTPSGLAARRRRQIGTSDFLAEPAFATHRQVIAAADIRAALSTPLLDFAGNVIGAVSTHHRAPQLPDPLSLRLVELLADLAGEQLAVQLRPGASDALAGADPAARDDAELAAMARAVISALLTPNGAGSRDGRRSPGVSTPDGGRHARSATHSPPTTCPSSPTCSSPGCSRSACSSTARAASCPSARPPPGCSPRPATSTHSSTTSARR
ncbi:MAG TPA: GAF domain-containing protein [Jatrophihabitans sp.]